eukprot:TRINITY_DN65526_c0_g1_i1.p1 TRINITY_DN65526_c0_g1~~TRINITY_DN65526_c0_g1_i1.p1  ORF type:complete len:455 (+),score=51.26 TRINITY_DN65526_c0_g1_i1:66-1430(+)
MSAREVQARETPLIQPGTSAKEGQASETPPPQLGTSDQSAAQLEVERIQVYLVYMTVFFDILGSSISTPIMPFYAKSFGVGDAGVGYLYGMWNFTASIFPPYLGKMSDKYGRKPVLCACLLGAGVAALGQGFAANFLVFLLARACSGIWGAVGSTAQVYITDVAPEPIRAGYLNKLSVMGPAAVIFGPGIGGALSTVSLNFPIITDGLITICMSAFLMYKLQETPAYLRKKAAAGTSVSPGSPAHTGASSVDEPLPPTPLAIHVIGISTFFLGAVFGIRVSMFAIYMQGNYNMEASHIGYIFCAAGLTMVVTTMFLTKRIQGKLGMYNSCIAGSLFNGACLLLMVMIKNEWVGIAMFTLSNIGIVVRMASNASVVSGMTVTANRGKLVGVVLMYNNIGRCLGPICAGWLADIDVDWPFWLCVAASCVSALMVSAAARISERERTPASSQAPSSV